METMSDQETLTQNRQMANVAVMSDDDQKQRKDNDDAVKPIMIYPQSAEQRRLFKEAADLENRKLSPFIVHVVSEYVRKQKRSRLAAERTEAKSA
jgi:hypothetical protein